MKEEAVHSRNSPFRKVTEKARRSVVEIGYGLFPNLHPNDLTKWRGTVFLAGAVWAYFKKGWGPAFTMGGAALTDSIDGEWNRLREERELGYSNPEGWRKDNKTDRKQEIGVCLLRAIKAFREGDILRGYLALGEMATNTWTSTARKFAESQGIEVSEFPKGPKYTLPIRVLGNHGGRMVKETVLAAVENRYLEIGLSVLQIIGNIYTTVDRIRTWREGKRKELPEGVRGAEREKFNYLLSVTGQTFIMAGGAFLLERAFNKVRR